MMLLKFVQRRKMAKSCVCRPWKVLGGKRGYASIR
jgi:hypothetical protein